MNKPNDFIAVQLNAPSDFTLADLYTHGITPSNTTLQSKDSYKDIPQVQNRFKKEDGTFDDKAFDAFYDSALRSYNDWAQTDFANDILANIPIAPENTQEFRNRNRRDVSARLVQSNDPWRHQRGFGNLYETGAPSFDIREVAQANNVRDAEGNVLDYTPNEEGGFLKALKRKPMYLAYDENGELMLDEKGDPFYKELAEGESTYGKEMLHYTDTFTPDDSWLNKFDFMDNDGLDKSVGGTIARTLFTIAPYFIPGVGQVFGAIGATYGLARSLPVLAKAVNGIITNESDNTAFGKSMNDIESYLARFDTSKSRYSMDHNWSFENVADMIVTSAKQLFEQRTFTKIPEILKLPKSGFNRGLFGTMSLGYMAMTSAEDALETFKQAGMSDRSAGIAMLAYTASLFGLMQGDYFKDMIFKDTWINSAPEITRALSENSKVSAKVALGAIENATAKNPKLLTLTEGVTPEESQKLFRVVFNATKNAWKDKSLAPFKGINWGDLMPGAAFNQGNIYLNRALNEGIEEVMEEVDIDLVKLAALGLESMGFNIKDETKEKLDFGLTWNDALQRYTTSFVGGAIGGAVFQGMDDWHNKILNKNMSDYAGRGVNGELIRAIRNYGSDYVIKELERLRNKGYLGNKNLGITGRMVDDPEHEGQKKFVWDEAGDKMNQNDLMFNLMRNRIQTIANVLNDNNLLLDDNKILKEIDQSVAKEAEAAGMSVEEYCRKNHIQVFDEFAKKTGFADVILTDVGNLLIDLTEVSDKIEARRQYLSDQFRDNENADKESTIKKDSHLKELERQEKEIKQKLEDIREGKAASYYIRYANFASHDTLVSNFENLDIDKFAFYKYRTTYSTADEETKKSIDADFAEFVKLQGIGKLEAANNLFQHIQDLTLDTINKQQKDLLPAIMSSATYGSQVDLENVDPSIALDRDGTIDVDALSKAGTEAFNEDGTLKEDFVILWHDRAKALLRTPIDAEGKPITIGQRYQQVINDAIDTYKSLKESNRVGVGVDDYLKYAFKLIADDFRGRIGLIDEEMKQFKKNHPILNEKILNFLGNVKDRTELIAFLEGYNDEKLKEQAENLRKYPDDDEVFNEAVDTATNYFSSPIDEQDFKNKYKEILSNLNENPEKALSLISEFEKKFDTILDSELKEAMLNAFNLDLLKTVATGIKQAVDLSKELTPSPVIELAKLIAFDLNGEELPLLDMIAQQKSALADKGVNEYLITDEFISKQLPVAKSLLPILRSVVWAASSGINENANNMLKSEGKEQLPVISSDLASVYRNDLEFLENQIELIEDLHERNSKAKTREQILCRKNFYRNVLNFITNVDNNEDATEALKRLQAALGDFDLVQRATNLGLVGLDFDDESSENQIKMMKLFSDFEHEIYEHVRNKGLALPDVGHNIFMTFNDLFKQKNGELTIKEEDPIQNNDIASYFLSVVGCDSYWFGKKLLEKYNAAPNAHFPFFGQELATRLICANILHPELINGAQDGLAENIQRAIDEKWIRPEPGEAELQEVDKTYLKDKPKLWNTVIIDGFAGTGKSTVVLNTALSFFDNTEVVGVCSIESRAKAMGFDDAHTFTLNDMLKQGLPEDTDISTLHTKDNGHSHKRVNPEVKFSFKNILKSDKQKVVVIDECTRVKEYEWDLLTEAAKNEGVVIIGLGNTMQTGETYSNDGNVSSAGLEDCISIISPKLTISMRDANAGKANNNDKVGRIVARLIDYKRDNPAWSDKAVIANYILPAISLQYTYGLDGSLCGDVVLDSITNDDIEASIKTLKEGETLAIITPSDSFTDLREKYKDNPAVTFITPGEAQGSEYDYVILNTEFSGDTLSIISTLQDFYTLLTRAKKGTKIKKSAGTNLLKVTSDDVVTASANITFDNNSDVAKQYRDTRIEALKQIPNTENPAPAPAPSPTPAPAPKPRVDDDALGTTDDVSEQEILDDIDKELSGEEEVGEAQESTRGNSGDEQLGEGLKGEMAKAYKHYRSLKQYGDLVIDLESFGEFINSLTQKDPLLAFSGLISDNGISDEDFEQVKNFLRAMSSIILNYSGEARYSKFNTRKIGWSAVADIDDNGVLSQLEQSLASNSGVFFKKKHDDKMLLFYCFGEHYAIPVALCDSTDRNEQFVKDILFKQETPVIPITSKGKKRTSVQKVLGNWVTVASSEGNPLTAIFVNPKDTDFEHTKKNDYFASNAGKAMAILLSQFGMTEEEMKELLNPEIDENSGKITYFTSNQPNLFSIAGVQQNVSANRFLEILSYVNRLLEGNEQSEYNATAVKEIASFFGKTEDEVREAFTTITSLDRTTSKQEQGKQFAKIRSQYNMLYTSEIDSFITGLMYYFMNETDENRYQFTGNIYTTVMSDFTATNNGEDTRRRAIKFAVKDAQQNEYNFYIVRQSKDKFDLYYTNTDWFNLIDAKPIGTLDFHQIFTDAKFDPELLLRTLSPYVNAQNIGIELNEKSSITDLLKNNQIVLSIATAYRYDDDGVIRYFPCFESQISKLIKDTNFNEDAFVKFLKNSTIFKYGLYRQIIAGQAIDPRNIWAEGVVNFDELSWDIIKVLAPLYTFQMGEEVNSLETVTKYKDLRTPGISEETGITLVANGNVLRFAEDGNAVTIPISDKLRDLFEKNGRAIGSNYSLKEVAVNEGTLEFFITSSTGNSTIVIQGKSDLLKDLFEKANNAKRFDFNSLIRIQNKGRYSHKGTDFNLVLANGNPKLQDSSGKLHSYTLYGKYSENGKYFVFLESPLFGNNGIQEIEVSQNNILYDNAPNKMVLGYITYDTSGGKSILTYRNGEYYFEENGKDVEVSKIQIEGNKLYFDVHGTEVQLDSAQLFNSRWNWINNQFRRINPETIVPFKQKVTDVLKPYLSSLPDLEQVLLTKEDLDEVNKYLASKINELGKRIVLVQSKSGKLEISKDFDLENEIYKALRQTRPELNLNDVTIQISDDSSSEFHKFFVYLQNELLATGELSKVKNNWKVQFTREEAKEKTVEDFKNDLIAITADSAGDQNIEQIKNFLFTKFKNPKGKLGKTQMMISMQLIQRAKALKDSGKPVEEYDVIDKLAMLNDEWTTFNQNCKF